eukprot:5064376-Pleurochrysis_carterae.AAC.1
MTAVCAYTALRTDSPGRDAEPGDQHGRGACACAAAFRTVQANAACDACHRVYEEPGAAIFAIGTATARTRPPFAVPKGDFVRQTKGHFAVAESKVPNTLCRDRTATFSHARLS